MMHFPLIECEVSGPNQLSDYSARSFCSSENPREWGLACRWHGSVTQLSTPREMRKIVRIRRDRPGGKTKANKGKTKPNSLSSAFTKYDNFFFESFFEVPNHSITSRALNRVTEL